MCGEQMRLQVRQLPEKLPGRTQQVIRNVREWICPGCDYFEEADTGEG